MVINHLLNGMILQVGFWHEHSTLATIRPIFSSHPSLRPLRTMEKWLQGGPLQAKSGVSYNPYTVSRVISPQLPIEFRPFIGVINL